MSHQLALVHGFTVRQAAKPAAPRKAAPSVTGAQFGAFDSMFRHFNATLFDGQLPPVLLNFSRHQGALGFFAPGRWTKEHQEKGTRPIHEISLNPSWLRRRTAIQVASTLVHEMCHLWQEENGTPGRRGYHNEEWARIMDSVGLGPSTTGERGGKRVGQKVTHYIVDGGPFSKAFASMPEACKLPLLCDEPSPAAKAKAKKKNKTKYSCPGCGDNVWGKPELLITCERCEARFEEEGGDQGDEG